ncbi:ABC transporter A family member 1 [Tetrabaena socialis]|uniref:ABC transporter A family member 1 n=1 Tax=Tetrabaena socialis TaxID=47790 RepID=A0A2J8AC87_9CHLO|nr:ABC transporter A family member 1 [Tetrabaena socialis]|eukprot:PNH10126.1 ABC transporter A family member 1 [Tetrabaena socialis]
MGARAPPPPGPQVYDNGTAALSGLSFGLDGGECLALVGRNGAGKSTALAVLSGRLRPTRGSVRLGGVDIAGRPDAARGRVAMCPQTDPLLPLLTPAEHLALYAALHGPRHTALRHNTHAAGPPTSVASTTARSGPPSASSWAALAGSDAARRCGLPPELLRRPVAQLSGGSKRKLSLALALLGAPQLLLLDEPSAGMDPPGRRGMCDTINMALHGSMYGSPRSPHCGGDDMYGGGGGVYVSAGAGRPAVVLTTHFWEEATALADWVGVMEGGRLLALGRPEAALPGGGGGGVGGGAAAVGARCG